MKKYFQETIQLEMSEINERDILQVLIKLIKNKARNKNEDFYFLPSWKREYYFLKAFAR